jgi:hypothetical protein
MKKLLKAFKHKGEEYELDYLISQVENGARYWADNKHLFLGYVPN